MNQNHDFCHFLDTLDDDHLRKMKKTGPQNMTNIEKQVILRKFLHKYKPVTPLYPRRKSVDFAGRTEVDARRWTDGQTNIRFLRPPTQRAPSGQLIMFLTIRPEVYPLAKIVKLGWPEIGTFVAQRIQDPTPRHGTSRTPPQSCRRLIQSVM